MKRNRLIQLLCLAAATLLLGSTSLLQPTIDRQRRELHLTHEWRDVDQSLPPGVALATAALGSFRGLFVDVLWYRTNSLQDAGKFYEANKLSQWITRLQPRFPKVWAFHAWNNAYNISVATHTADERWYWVNSGVQLLRDRGIVWNPTTPSLYKELAWIFSHKIGQVTDDMHWYYKRKLAEEWTEVLGSPKDSATTEELVAAIRRIHNAPHSLRDLLTDNPHVGPLWQYLTGLGYEANADLLRQIGGILMYNYSPDQALWEEIGLVVPKQYDQRLNRIFKDASFGPAVEPLLAFLRKHVLQENYHMETEDMLDLMERFGPMDWRHPATHGAFWNHLGVKVTEASMEPTKVKAINIFRARIHAIQALAKWGKISFDPNMAGPPDLLPDPRFVDTYEVALAEAKDYLERREATRGTYKGFETGHENFLLKYLVDAYFLGGIDEATRIYEKLRKLYGHKPHNKNRYKLALEELFIQEHADIWDQMMMSRSTIENSILRAIDRGLASNSPDVFGHGLSLARFFYERYQKDKVKNPNAPRNRQDLPPFEQILESAYIGYMAQLNFSITRRARVWRNTPIQLQQRVYDRLYRGILAQAQSMMFDPDRVLPKPPDMVEFRKGRQQYESPEEKLDAAKTIERQ